MEWGDLGSILIKCVGEYVDIEYIFKNKDLEKPFREIFPDYPFIEPEQKTFAALKGFSVPATLEHAKLKDGKVMLTNESILHYYNEMIRVIAVKEDDVPKRRFLCRAREIMRDIKQLV